MSSGPLPSRVDFRKLAEQRGSVEGPLPVAAFARLSGLLESDAGEISIALAFEPGKGRNPRVSGHCHGAVSMLCQNCLEPVRITLDVDIDVIVVASMEQLIEMDREEDGLVCDGNLLSIVEIVEDDLMVSLPMVPRHEDGQCGETWRPETDTDDNDDGASDTHRPFAGLEALKKDLKRSE